MRADRVIPHWYLIVVKRMKQNILWYPRYTYASSSQAEKPCCSVFQARVGWLLSIRIILKPFPVVRFYDSVILALYWSVLPMACVSNSWSKGLIVAWLLEPLTCTASLSRALLWIKVLGNQHAVFLLSVSLLYSWHSSVQGPYLNFSIHELYKARGSNLFA